MSKVYNTRKLQIFVLCQFMAKEYNFYYCGTGFISDDDGSYLPFKEAVKLFNEEESSKKDIEKVKLTYSKKDKKIICLDKGSLFYFGDDMYLSNLKRSAAMSVLRLNFEERQEFIDSHQYDPSNSNHMVLWNRDSTRERALFRYYPHYTVDNLYECFVVKNTITVLNKLCRYTGSQSFTLGHHKPVTKGGEHHCANWFIQTRLDNQRQGDSLLSTPKMSYEEQEKYIKNNMPDVLDNNYTDLAISLLLKFETVYRATYNG